MEEFSRAIFSYQFGPPDFFGGLSHIYDVSPDGGYVRMFGKELGPLSQGEFERLFGIWLVTSRIAEKLKVDKRNFDPMDEDQSDLMRKKALERKHLVFYAAGEVLREISRQKGEAESDLLKSFSKPKWLETLAKRSFIDEAYGVACDMVTQAYMMAASKPTFVHRNFFRDDETLNNIRAAKAAQRGQLQRLLTMLTT